MTTADPAAAPIGASSQHLQRYVSLDGLRGLGIVLVVICHCLFVSPQLADIFRYGTPATTDWVQQFILAPVMAAGTGSLIMFFVLSGFVLPLPFLMRSRSHGWRRHYAQRFVRIYLPLGASLIFAAALFVLAPRTAQPGASWWMNGHDLPLSAGLVLRDWFLLSGNSWLNSPIWSLRVEVIFVVVLPVILLVITRVGARARLVLAALLPLLTVIASVVGSTTVAYVMMFSLGILMAVERERVRALTAGFSGRTWTVVVVVAILLLPSDAYLWVGHTPVAPALAAVGAAVLIAATMYCPAVGRLCESRPALWLGHRSFSLLLVHEPIVVTVALLLGTQDAALVMLIALPVSLAVTATFFRLVELPSHRAARQAGRLVTPAAVPGAGPR